VPSLIRLNHLYRQAVVNLDTTAFKTSTYMYMYIDIDSYLDGREQAWECR
jgi:hypothetical protein